MVPELPDMQNSVSQKVTRISASMMKSSVYNQSAANTDAVLTFKVLHGLAPQYLGPLNRVADLPGRRSLRSAGTSHLVVPPVRLSSVANRAFQIVGPRIWNDLPVDVTSAESLSTFRQRLKTHLFSKSLPGH